MTLSTADLLTLRKIRAEIQRQEKILAKLKNDTRYLVLYPNKFGDVEGGNYSEFESDGTLVYNGDSTVWEDLNFDPLKSGGPAAQRPDDVTINNVFHKEFTSANNQSCGDAEEIEHAAMLNQIYYPHLHLFLKSGESAGTTGVSFTFYWELRDSGTLTTGNVVLTATSAELTNNSVAFTVFDSSGFAGPTGLEAQLTVALYRTAGDAEDVVVTSYGIHYKKDMAGSRTIATK